MAYILLSYTKVPVQQLVNVSSISVAPEIRERGGRRNPFIEFPQTPHVHYNYVLHVISYTCTIMYIRTYLLNTHYNIF